MIVVGIRTAIAATPNHHAAELDRHSLEVVEGMKELNLDIRRLWRLHTDLDRSFMGQVEEIELVKVTGERLYWVKYEDGDLHHFTAEEVREYMVISALAKAKKPAGPASATRMPGGSLDPN